jgi:hypothetical protein
MYTHARASTSDPLLVDSCLQGLDIKVVALVNDTVGTLMAKSYTNPKCRIGVILGERWPMLHTLHLS